MCIIIEKAIILCAEKKLKISFGIISLMRYLILQTQIFFYSN